MLAAVSTPNKGGDDNKTIMEKIQELEGKKPDGKTEEKTDSPEEKKQKQRKDKENFILSLREKCKYHILNGGIQACLAETKNHCFKHSEAMLLSYPCHMCPQAVRDRFKKGN